MEYAAYWFIASIIVGIIASSKDRSGLGYFFISLFFSPLLIGILILVLPSLKEQAIRISGEEASPKTHVRCPDCRELVRMDANVCKHCRTRLKPVALPG